MPSMTPEQEAAYALDYGTERRGLSPAAQAEYDRLVKEGRPRLAPEPQIPARSSPEVRARILEMFKRINRKYAIPFERDRLAVASVFGGDWEEYGQIVLQMAILDTLLSIEELLTRPASSGGTTAAPQEVR